MTDVRLKLSREPPYGTDFLSASIVQISTRSIFLPLLLEGSPELTPDYS